MPEITAQQRACNLACEFIQNDWLKAELPWLEGRQRSLAIDILQRKIATHTQAAIRADREQLAQEAERIAGEINNYVEWTWSNVAAWLRQKIGE